MKLNSVLLLSFGVALSMISCDPDIDVTVGSSIPSFELSHYLVLFYTNDTSFKTSEGYFTVSSYDTPTDTIHHPVLFRSTRPICTDDKVDSVVKLYLNLKAHYYIDAYKYTPSGAVRVGEVSLTIPEASGCEPFNLSY